MSNTAIISPDRLALSVAEARAAIGISHASFYELINSGAIHTVKAGGRRLVPVSAIHAFLEGGASDAA